MLTATSKNNELRKIPFIHTSIEASLPIKDAIGVCWSFQQHKAVIIYQAKFLQIRVRYKASRSRVLKVDKIGEGSR
jgi:hypothetical protein